MKETDWFSVIVTPVRVGVYKTWHRGEDGTLYGGYSYWDGRKWGYTQPNPSMAAYRNAFPSTQQSREWCGIHKEEA